MGPSNQNYYVFDSFGLTNKMHRYKICSIEEVYPTNITNLRLFGNAIKMRPRQRHLTLDQNTK